MAAIEISSAKFQKNLLLWIWPWQSTKWSLNEILYTRPSTEYSRNVIGVEFYRRISLIVFSRTKEMIVLCFYYQQIMVLKLLALRCCFVLLILVSVYFVFELQQVSIQKYIFMVIIFSNEVKMQRFLPRPTTTTVLNEVRIFLFEKTVQ